ncbi:hypothetical protein [Rosettibacter firmus]|uniref:hypothetical protein n=1 Tax=Rosettibacter firmus TaxID=3111522 RepID=UPI00336C1B60
MSVNSNEKPFIAELHDIGKLVDRDSLKRSGIKIRGHTFHDFDFSQIGISQPSSPSWYAQLTDEVRSLSSTKVPKDNLPDVLLTRIADELASAISRTWGGSEDFQNRKKRGEFTVEGIYVVWNPNYYQREKVKAKKWAAFDTPSSLKNMFEFIENCGNSNEIFERFGNNLKLTPEDKSVPFNIVSLYTHLELTGKIYRILKRHSRIVEKNGNLYLEYLGDQIQTIIEATGGKIDEPRQRGKWIYRLVFFYISFPQSLSRLQDLNIFKKRSDLIKAFSEDENKKDYVLFFTDDFMCLLMPKEDVVQIQELLKPFLEAGFTIAYREMEAELNLLTSSMERAYEKFPRGSSNRYLKLYEKSVTPDSPTQIQPPLCDSCQMRQGKERVKDNIHEYLCDTCYDIREMGEPAYEYANWEEEGLRAAWMKITLNQEHLLNAIQKLYEDYVDTHPALQSISSKDKMALKESFRPLAVQMDFIKDYKLLLSAFNEQIYRIKDTEGKPLFTKESFLTPIDDYYEFGIFKVYSGKEILAVIDLFYSLMESYFPNCLQDSPIKLSLSIAQVKYPYQEHWRFLSKPENSINLRSPGSAKLSLDLVRYKLLRETIGGEDSKLSHFLHRLADIERETRSHITVELELLNNRKKFPAIWELTQKGISVQQILNFYKLIKKEAPYERPK